MLDLTTTEGMLKHLEMAFPTQCPSVDMTDRAIWVYAGKVQLINHIRFKLQEAQEIIPEVLNKGD